MKKAILFASAACVGLPAAMTHAGVFFEVEPNDSMATATVIARPAGPFADVGFGTFRDGGGDLDFFAVDLLAGEILIATSTPLEDFGIAPDTFMGLFNSAGVLLDSNDDGGPGLGSEIVHAVAADDTYFIALTGFPDFDFEGDHSEEGRYSLSVKVVPAPPALAALLGAFAIRRRRRNA